MSFDIDLGNFMIRFMSVDANLSIEKVHLLSEKKINSLKTERFF